MTFKPATWPRKLRSQEWYGGTSRDAIYHRGWMKNQGYPHDLFDGRPVIGILNTWSDLTPCNGHLRELAEKVKAGVWEGRGIPVEVPVFSASENTFVDRHDVSQPRGTRHRGTDARPADRRRGPACRLRQDHALASHGRRLGDLPSIIVTGGPMLNGYFRGERGFGNASVEILRSREGRRDDAGRVP